MGTSQSYPPAGDIDWVLCVCEKKKSGWGMVAQWWGELPPNPPGMSAANQAASVGIDFGCLEKGTNP